MAEPIGLKLIACLLLGPGMVLELKKSGSGYRFAGKPEKTGFQWLFINGVSRFFLNYREYLGRGQPLKLPKDQNIHFLPQPRR